jgi:nucleotide-binding universal stress UspA family protein
LSARITRPNAAPFVATVVHPTDFSEASQTAFAHALAVAAVRKTRLDILHVSDKDSQSWSRFPSVRKTLERWGLLDPGSDRSAVFDELSVRVKKVQLRGDPASETLSYIRKVEPDLLVLATEGRHGLARLIEPSVAQSVARRAHTMTLFVAEKGRGFVSLEDGHLSLNRILVPIDKTPDASNAIIAATRAAEALGDAPVEINLLHVGDGSFPHYALPESEIWTWKETRGGGDVDDEILSVAQSTHADLVVMATDGRNGVLDAIRGSFTERVVRRAECPVLAVPSST